MQAMRLPVYRRAEDQPLAIDQLDIPVPEATQVRLRVQTCGVCHTDLHTVEGDIRPPRLPRATHHRRTQTAVVLKSAPQSAALQ